LPRTTADSNSLPRIDWNQAREVDAIESRKRRRWVTELVTGLPICHPRAVRLGVVLIVLLLALAAPAPAHTGGAFRSVAQVMRAIDDARIRVGTKVVRVDSDTTLCSGEGQARLRRGVRTWTHFRCTFSTFTAGGPGRDVEFRLHALDSRRIATTSARWIAG
jgi:hypothetical protein